MGLVYVDVLRGSVLVLLISGCLRRERSSLGMRERETALWSEKRRKAAARASGGISMIIMMVIMISDRVLGSIRTSDIAGLVHMTITADVQVIAGRIGCT